VLVGRKARHIDANLRQDSRGCGRLQARNGLHQLHRLFKRVQALLNLLFNVSDGLIEKVNMRQDALEKKAMMRLHASFQSQTQIRELGAQSPASHGSQGFGILLSPHHRFEYVTSTLAQHIGRHRR
jgi:hypothetical protein